MPQWGGTDNAANSVFWAADQLNVRANTANKTALYGNTTMGAFVGKQVVSQEGLKTSDLPAGSAHAGWALKKVGTGSIVSITISAGGSGYANTDLINVAVTGTGSVNASATVSTNATGGITSVTITNAGSGFITVNPTVTVTNATGGSTGGSSATLVATAGGRAGRTTYETLVASGTLA